jgi:hypothetical protein
MGACRQERMISLPDFRQIRVDVPRACSDDYPEPTARSQRNHRRHATELGTAFEALGPDRIEDTSLGSRASGNSQMSPVT